MTVATNDILGLVEDRLRLIKTSNGYYTTVKKVELGRLEAFKGYDLPAINFWTDGFKNARFAGGTDERSMSLFVQYLHKTWDEEFPMACGKLAHDVGTALNRSTSAPAVSDDISLDLGCEVSDVTIDDCEYDQSKGQTPWFGVAMAFTIKYITTINDMTNYNP